MPRSYPTVEFRNCKRSSLFASISRSFESLCTFSLIFLPVRTLRFSSLSFFLSLSLCRLFLSRSLSLSFCLDLRLSLSWLRERDFERVRVRVRLLSYERERDLGWLRFAGRLESFETLEEDELKERERRFLGVYKGSYVHDATAPSPAVLLRRFTVTVVILVPLLCTLRFRVVMFAGMVWASGPGAFAFTALTPINLFLTSEATSLGRTRPAIPPVTS